MKNRYFFLILIALLTSTLSADDSDWNSDSWEGDSSTNELENDTFEKMKIKNRSKKEYDDKIYKYITGDYHAPNNNIRLSTVHLNDSLINDDIKVNVHIEDLEIEGNSFKDSIEIKHNPYKNFVKNNQSPDFFGEDSTIDGLENSLESTGDVKVSKYDEIVDTDTTEIEEINIENKEKIKEINIFIEDTNIVVD